MHKAKSIKMSNFVRNKKMNPPPYYECMEEDFLLAGKGDSGEQVLGDDTCATIEPANHHPLLEYVGRAKRNFRLTHSPHSFVKQNFTFP